MIANWGHMIPDVCNNNLIDSCDCWYSNMIADLGNLILNLGSMLADWGDMIANFGASSILPKSGVILPKFDIGTDGAWIGIESNDCTASTGKVLIKS